MFLGDVLLLRFPLHTKGGVGQHVVEAPLRVAVAVHSAVFAFARAQGVAEDDVSNILALDHQIRSADGKGFGVVFLAEQLQVGLGVVFQDIVFGDRQHTAGAHGGIVDGDHAAGVVDLFVVGVEDMHHEGDHLAGGEVVSGLLVGLLIEPPH